MDISGVQVYRWGTIPIFASVGRGYSLVADFENGQVGVFDNTTVELGLATSGYGGGLNFSNGPIRGFEDSVKEYSGFSTLIGAGGNLSAGPMIEGDIDYWRAGLGNPLQKSEPMGELATLTLGGGLPPGLGGHGHVGASYAEPIFMIRRIPSWMMRTLVDAMHYAWGYDEESSLWADPRDVVRQY